MALKIRSLIPRVTTGLVLLPTVFLLIWWPGLDLAFSVFVAFLAAAGLYEYYSMVRERMIASETIGGICAGTAVTFSGWFGTPVVTMLALYGALLLVSCLHLARGHHSVAGLAASAFGVLYVGWLAAHFVLLRGVPVIGPGLVTLLVVAVVLTDAGAYFIGSLIGKHKMAPSVSPNKTWEGALGGFAAALLGMIVCYLLSTSAGWAAFPSWNLGYYLLTGALLSVVAQVGDLTESCLKRSAGIKDSGRLFPGHGGVLDRCDGFLFAAPVLYYMAMPTWQV